MFQPYMSPTAFAGCLFDENLFFEFPFKTDNDINAAQIKIDLLNVRASLCFLRFHFSQNAFIYQGRLLLSVGPIVCLLGSLFVKRCMLSKIVFVFGFSQSNGIFKPKMVGRFPIQIPEIYFSKGTRDDFLIVCSRIPQHRCSHSFAHA